VDSNFLRLECPGIISFKIRALFLLQEASVDSVYVGTHFGNISTRIGVGITALIKENMFPRCITCQGPHPRRALQMGNRERAFKGLRMHVIEFFCQNTLNVCH